MRSIVRIAFAALVCSFSLPAALITETWVTTYRGSPPASCDHTGTTFSHCEAESYDPAFGSYRGEATARASYGYLSVESIISSSGDLHWVVAGAGASFTDRVTVTGSDRIGWAEAIWDISDFWCYGGCDVFYSDFNFTPSRGNAIDLFAELGAGDPLSIIAAVSGSIQLESIRVFDAEFNQLTGLYYRSESGAAYNVEGATQVPEPGSAFTAAAALTLLAAVRRLRRTGLSC